MKKEYISPMIGTETILCGVVLTSPTDTDSSDISFGGPGNDMTSDAPSRGAGIGGL